jgi:hypothetical protein
VKHHDRRKRDQTVEREHRSVPAELLDQMGGEDAVDIGIEREAGSETEAGGQQRPRVLTKFAQIAHAVLLSLRRTFPGDLRVAAQLYNSTAMFLQRFGEAA